MIPSRQRSSVEEYLAPFSLEKMSSTLGMGHKNFCMTLFKTLQTITRHFPTSPLGITMIDTDQLEWLL